LQWQFKTVDLILARLTVLVSCSDELAVSSCPLLCLQRKVVKLESGLFYVGLYYV